MKKRLVLLLAFLMALSVLSAASASVGNIDIVDIELIEKMDVIHTALSTAATDNASSIGSTNGGFYGGFYYENGKIVLLTTERGSQSAALAAYRSDKDIIIRQCDYTYAEIEQAWKTVANHADEIPNFVSVGIAPKKNRVILAVEDESKFCPEQFAWFPGSIVEVVQSEPIAPTASIGCGNTMKNATRGNYPNVSVPSTDPGNLGAAEATDTVNVRSGPGTSYAILGQLYRGQTVATWAVEGDWVKITYKIESQPGYVHISYLKWEEGEGPQSAADSPLLPQTGGEAAPFGLLLVLAAALAGAAAVQTVRAHCKMK